MSAQGRLLQVERAHASAKPTDANPAWLNAHRDLGFALEQIGRMQRKLDAYEKALDEELNRRGSRSPYSQVQQTCFRIKNRFHELTGELT